MIEIDKDQAENVCATLEYYHSVLHHEGAIPYCTCGVASQWRLLKTTASNEGPRVYAVPIIKDQPAPTHSDRPAVWDLVIADMHERDGVGRERYGTPLQAHNGRDALVDAYQEVLDLAVYLRQEIEERSTL